MREYRRMIRHGWLALVIFGMLFPALAGADICSGVPDCHKQRKSTKVKALQTEGWAFYCSGDAPYYWNWSKDASCCSVIENPFEESSKQPGKLDVTITNWTLKEHTVDITMACSSVNQYGPPCTHSSEKFGDPKCPTVPGTSQNTCSQGPIPVCIQTWQETCSNGTSYYCTDDQTVIWCQKCD